MGLNVTNAQQTVRTKTGLNIFAHFLFNEESAKNYQVTVRSIPYTE
jgi:hypothetical protein